MEKDDHTCICQRQTQPGL